MFTTNRISQIINLSSELEILGKECSYQYYLLIEQTKNALLSRLLSSVIPISSALSLLTKLLSDIVRILKFIHQSIKTDEFASGNIQVLVVDSVEYLRHLLGIVFGISAAWVSPEWAADTFLTKMPDPTETYLNHKEAALLYALADGLHNFFIEHKIDYRICCGTALGAKREGGIIRNDDDIDLMIHPNSVNSLTELINNKIFFNETGISIEMQPWTGGWQSFYAHTPKGPIHSPLEKIGKPFVDIFPGVFRRKNKKDVISYGENKMYNQSRDDYFTQEEWSEPPKLYQFGPTKLYGIESIDNYLKRSYGPLALKYVARLYPHELFANIYANPRNISSLWLKPAPRYLRHVQKAPLDYDKKDYESKKNMI